MNNLFMSACVAFYTMNDGVGVGVGDGDGARFCVGRR